jgi:hypothetical protein
MLTTATFRLLYLRYCYSLLMTDDNVPHLLQIASYLCCVATEVINFQFSACQLLSVAHIETRRLQ